MKKVGFIGVGVMGKSMVRNLMKYGFDVSIYARDRAKVEDVIQEGARFYDTIPALAKQVAFLITIVGFPTDVEEVYLGKDGILNNIAKGSYVIDMTTSSPKLAIQIYQAAKEKGIFALDAPVTGGDIGAKNGTLTILAGGEEPAYQACMPLFHAMGKNICYQGTAGNGQNAKLTNQIMLAGIVAGLCEGIAYADKKGLNTKKLLGDLSGGAAGSKQLEVLAPKIFASDNAPGFYIKHFIKDMKLALFEADVSGLTLNVLKQALSNYESLEKEGLGDLGTQALIKYYEEV